MEILEFIVGCLEALAHWRVVLMIALGLALGALLLMLVRPDPLDFILAGIGFLSCFIFGIFWERAAERRR